MDFHSAALIDVPAKDIYPVFPPLRAQYLVVGRCFYLPWFSFLKRSCTSSKSGLISAVSAQHWRMMFMASGGAAPLLTDGLISGGGLITFSIISARYETCDPRMLDNVLILARCWQSTASTRDSRVLCFIFYWPLTSMDQNRWVTN